MTYRYSSYNAEKEIDEAINAANDALYHLDAADTLLNKAKNWGIADILGGGIMISMIKRSKMEDANSEIRKSQEALRKLSRELNDIRGYNFDGLQFDGFSMAADVWFDNVFMDIAAQSQISKASNWVKNMIAEVEGLLDGLDEIRSSL